GGLPPVRDEGCLQRVDGRALDSDVRVAPLSEAASVAPPAVVDAEAARVADAPVDDDRPDVRAVRELVQGPPVRGTVDLDLDSAAAQIMDVFVAEPFRPDVVEQHQDLDTAARTLRKRLADLLGYVAWLEPVHLPRDQPLGRAQVLEKAREQ